MHAFNLTSASRGRAALGRFGRRIAPEMIGLAAVEMLICLMGLYLLLGQSTRPWPDWTAVRDATLLAVTMVLVAFSVGLYSHETYQRSQRLLAGIAVWGVLSCAGVLTVASVVGIELHHSAGASVLRALAIWLLILVALRLGFASAARTGFFDRRLILVGDDAEADRLLAAVRADHCGFVRIVGQVPGGPITPAAIAALPRAEVVVLTRAAAAALDEANLRALSDRRLSIVAAAEFWESVLHRIDVDHDTARLRDDAAPARGGWAHGGWAQRTLDVVLSLVLLLLTLPLMLLTALAVRLDSKGPVLYRQERLGLHGRPFTLLKFRSMRTDAEARGPVWASKADPRVTRVGAIIRLVRIDELPQLLNVLRGEMSFIGPRPERAHFTEQLEPMLPTFRDRLRVKPGLTGWAQVNYPYGASVEDARAKLSFDLYYVKHRTILLDVLILFATIRVVLFQTGAR